MKASVLKVRIKIYPWKAIDGREGKIYGMGFKPKLQKKTVKLPLLFLNQSKN